MESVEVATQDECCILEILQCESVEVESVCEELTSDCTIEDNIRSVNGEIIDIQVDQDSVPVPKAETTTLGDDTASERSKLKRKHSDSQCTNRSKFEDKAAVLDILLNSTTDKSTVPNKAEDKCFLLINERNLCNNRRIRKKRTFDIDCYEDWTFSSSKQHYFVMRDKTFEYVFKIDDVYYLPMTSSQHNKDGNGGGKKHVRHNQNVMKLVKQPSNEEILILTMTYGYINDFKRRISFVEQFPVNVTPKQKSLIFAEYSDILLPYESLAKAPKLKSKEIAKASKPKRAARQRNWQSKFETNDDSILQDVQNIIDGIASNDGKQELAPNDGSFLEKNHLIEKLLQAQTTLEEIPVGKKENEAIIIKNDENDKREAEGKKRLYIDDCGVWSNISVKKRWFMKIDGKYENVKCEGGKYEITNSATRSRIPVVKKTDILSMRWVYAKLKRAEEYRRRISWIDAFPNGVTPMQNHIAVAEYVGKYPGTNDTVHGNQKKSGGNPYVRTPSKAMQKMKDQMAFKTTGQIVAEDPDLQLTPQLKKKLENIRYRNSLRIAPGSVGSTEAMHDLLSLVQRNPFVQQVTFIKKKSPLVIGYTPEHVNAWKLRLSKESEQRVMGIDCSMTIGPFYLTVITYLHPNLLSRYTGVSAVMLGPVLIHVDKAVHAYTSFFNHVKDQLGSHKPDVFDGITLALGSRDDHPVLQAVNSCFPSSKLGHCVEHLENELRAFLTSEIGLARNEVNHITNELFSRLMSCEDEHDFNRRLTHLQSAYDVANPKLGAFFRKLGNDIKVKCWQPLIEGIPCMKWSQEGCTALQNIMSSVATLKSVSMSSAILKIQQAADTQLKDELSAIYDDGPYVLAPHAIKYFHEEKEWLHKTPKQKSKVIDGIRRQAKTSSRSKDH